MDIASLILARQVAQLGSFAAAARAGDVDPSSVSRAVANVEAQAGIRLFNRSTRSLSLTAEGAAYLERVGPALDEIAAAGEDAARVRSTPKGLVRLTASVAFGCERLVPLLPDLREALPDVELDLVLTDQRVDLAEQGIDLAIRLAASPQGDLISSKLRPTRYVVCAAPEYIAGHAPVNAPDDLLEHACLRYTLPGLRAAWWFKSDSGAVHEVPVRGPISISNPLALRAAVREGLGPGLLTDWLVADDLRSGRLVQLLPEFKATASEFETGAWLLYPSRSQLPRKTRAVMDFLKARLGQSASGGL